jgi:hypothetical protein
MRSNAIGEVQRIIATKSVRAESVPGNTRGARSVGRAIRGFAGRSSGRVNESIGLLATSNFVCEDA